MEAPAVKGAAPAGLIEQRFGQYTILEHLGTGGMGDVYKALHVGLDRSVALKILPPQLARSEGYSERFLAEAYAISRLQHQNIVTLYDYGEENGQKFIAMQFIQGMTLSRMVRAQFPLDCSRIINLTKPQARAFSVLPIDDLILTHLDEEPRWGKIWNIVLGTNYPVRFLSAAQNVPGEFLAATPERILTRQFPA